MISLTFCTPKWRICGNRPGDFGAVACVHPPSPRFRPSPAPFGGSLAREARPGRGSGGGRAGDEGAKCGGSRARGGAGLRSVGFRSGGSCPAGDGERAVLSPRGSKIGAGVCADPTQWGGAGRRRASPPPCGRARGRVAGRRTRPVEAAGPPRAIGERDGEGFGQGGTVEAARCGVPASGRGSQAARMRRGLRVEGWDGSRCGIEAPTVGRHRGLRAVRVRAGRGAGRRSRPTGRAAGSSRKMMERALGGRDGAVARCRRRRAPAPGVQACRPRSSASGPLPAPIAPTRSKPIHRRWIARDPGPGVDSELWAEIFPRTV